MKNPFFSSFFLTFILFLIPAAGSAASAMPPGCYAVAVNQNQLRTQFEAGDPDTNLTIAREAADFLGRYVDPATGRILNDLPDDVAAAFAAIDLGPGATIPGDGPLSRMQHLSTQIAGLEGNALQEQVASALFGRDVARILDVAHLGAGAFTQVMQLTNLDAMTLANLNQFVGLPTEQLNAMITALQTMPTQLQGWVDGTLDATKTAAMDSAMARLGITTADATALMELYKTDPRQMMAKLSETINDKIAEVGMAGLTQIKEALAQMVGNLAIASALTDLAQQGKAYITDLLSKLPINIDQLTAALRNIFGNLFNLNWLLGGKGMGEDFGYRDEKLTGLDKVWGPQPSVPMPHKRTAILSPVKDLSKWYTTNIQMPATAAEATKTQVSPDVMPWVGQYAPYVGSVYRGANDLNLFRQRINQPGAGTSPLTCAALLKKGDPYDPAWGRVDVDACVNQWILNHARYVRIIHEEAGAYRSINETMCQAMRIVPLTSEDKKDYNPSEYIGAAWNKLLNSSSSLMRGGKAKAEPHYASVGTVGNKGSFNVTIENPIAPPAQFGAISLSDLTEKVPERIIDPSHPFSPRWDFEFNERDKYSPLTAGYDQQGAVTFSSVRCAGTMLNRIPVDLMDFRLQHKFSGSPRAANFHHWIMRRIAGNYAAMVTYLPNGDTLWDSAGCSASEPCCSTAYDVEDTLQEPLRTMYCGQPRIDEMCEYMARPLAPLNVLKLRDSLDYTVYPDDDANGFADVPDGYKFSTYFANHRPYMRCWDTGRECGGESSSPDWESSKGANYALMGAGREGESCKIGGDGKIDYLPGSIIPYGNPNPILDWMELKLYQVSAQRRLGLKCIPRHEESFKIGQGEHFALYKGGIEVPQPDPTNPGRSINITWPWSWRGYVGDPVEQDRFPNFAAPSTPSVEEGLDGALQGDYLIFDTEVVGKKRLPYVGIVVDQNNLASNDKATEETSFVSMYAINHGKFPDACANTDRLFTGAKMTLWKKTLPSNVDTLLNDLGAGAGHASKECEDPALSNCIEPLWSKVKRYRPVDDRRG